MCLTITNEMMGIMAFNLINSICCVEEKWIFDGTTQMEFISITTLISVERANLLKPF